MTRQIEACARVYCCRWFIVRVNSYSLLLGQCEDNIERSIKEVQSGPEHSVISHFMPLQSYASQFVKRYHSVVSCILNQQDLISKGKKL